VRDYAPDLAPLGRPVEVAMGGQAEEVRFFREVSPRPGPKVVFVDLPEYFNRPGIYGEQGRDYPDNARRFALFSRAVLEGIPRFIQGRVLIHAHDWHTALAIVYMRSYGELAARFRGTPAVLSVHNAGYQGHFPPSVMDQLSLPWELYNWRQLEWYGRVNFLKGGLSFADCAVTVSPTHADELRTPGGGFGLHDLYIALGDRMFGITNGIDQAVWDPSNDDQITANYTREDPTDKARCKAALQRNFGLPQRRRTPLFGMTCRLATQKGLDILLASDRLWNHDMQFIFVGAGEERYESALTHLATMRPRNVAVQFDFTDRLEHRLMAGSDLFLMPSQYEPCGLAQMRAQRYGTLPVARSVGGIKDTVEDDVTGFLFDAYDPRALDSAIDRALWRYNDRDAWSARMYAAMGRDFGWERSAARYHDVYRHALAMPHNRT
jgi:starch synthase